MTLGVPFRTRRFDSGRSTHRCDVAQRPELRSHKAVDAGSNPAVATSHRGGQTARRRALNPQMRVRFLLPVLRLIQPSVGGHCSGSSIGQSPALPRTEACRGRRCGFDSRPGRVSAYERPKVATRSTQGCSSEVERRSDTAGLSLVRFQPSLPVMSLGLECSAGAWRVPLRRAGVLPSPCSLSSSDATLRFGHAPLGARWGSIDLAHASLRRCQR